MVKKIDEREEKGQEEGEQKGMGVHVVGDTNGKEEGGERGRGKGNGAGYEVGRGSKQGYIPDLVINFCGPGERGVHGCPNDGPHPIEADRPGHQSEFRWRREGGGS